MEAMMRIIGRNIAAERERLMWSQKELAQAVTDRGVPLKDYTLGKIERGERAAEAEEVMTIADVLGVPLDALMRGPEWLKEANFSPRVTARLADDLGGYLVSAA